jgi:pimeloyl-ACP methyl ester carboxylesterase
MSDGEAGPDRPESKGSVSFQVNGLTVFAATGNGEPDPSRKSVIFVHGAGQDHSIWLLPMHYFASHDRNVIAVDLPGHGRSDGEALPSIETMADWLMDVLDAAGLGEAAVAGHSLGSLVALAAAARHPHRVTAIALLGTAAPMRVSGSLMSAAQNDPPRAIDMLTYWGYSKSAKLGGKPIPGDPILAAGHQLLEQARPGVILADLKACSDYAAGLEHAAAVRCPALLILGSEDRLTPPQAAAVLAGRLPGAETVLLEDCGHAMLAEQPDQVLQQLKKVV